MVLNRFALNAALKKKAFFCSCNVAVFCNLFSLPLWLDLQLENRSPISCDDSLLLCTCSLESKSVFFSKVEMEMVTLFSV